MVDIGDIVGNGAEGGTWYDIPGTKGEKRPRLLIKDLKPVKRRELVKRCTTRKRSRGGIDERVDFEKLSELILEQCVIDWENIEKDGEKLEVNQVNKVLLNDNWTEFEALVTAVVGDDQALQGAIQEIESKN